MGVGLCSYLLIGFWFERPEPYYAAKKAFVMNRIGDWGYTIGIITIFLVFGSMNFLDVFKRVEESAPAQSALTLICLALFFGATGKSAQLPLYSWLPDAMEGPTPVSALIHAATMVTSGIYLCVRLSPVFVMSPVAMRVFTCWRNLRNPSISVGSNGSSIQRRLYSSKALTSAMA